MTILSALAGVWMSLLSLVGLVQHPQQAVQTIQADLHSIASTSPLMQMPIVPIPGAASGTPASPSGSSATSASVSTNASATAGAAVTTMTLPSTGSPWQTALPLGDYKYTTSGPEKGYIYLCHVQPGGEGAQGVPTWISGNTWYPSEKVAVEGSVSWPNATYSMIISGAMRTIKSNGLPTDHPTGIFPIQSSDPAYKFDANPNTIEPQSYSFSLPAYPTMATTPNCIYGEVGIMNDGVPLFDGFDAEYRDAVAHETQDAWDGHPDQGGVYHDHGYEDSVMQDTPVSTVIGFAFDGFPITGGKLPDGTYLTTNDLDECHGLISTVTLDGKSVTTYHYVLTQDFPYSVGCFRGTSYEPKPGAPSGSSQQVGQSSGQSGSSGGQGSVSSSPVNTGGGTPPTPPQAAISACASASTGTNCSFSTPNGTLSGSCMTPPNQSTLVCIPGA